MKRVLQFAVIGIALALVSAACTSDADVASRNLSTAADQFEVQRRIVFFNGITDTYLLEITGKCSIQADVMDDQLEVTCKIAPNEFTKHFLGLSDNVSYLVEQLDPIDVDVFHNRLIFKPEVIVPNVDLVTSP